MIEGHSLVTAVVSSETESSKRPVLFCMKCGRWAEKRLDGLAGPFRQVIDRYGADVVRSISNGRRPDTHSELVNVQVAGQIDMNGSRVLAIEGGSGPLNVGASQRQGRLAGPCRRKEAS